MSTKKNGVDLATVKTALREFAASRADLPQAEAEREFGALLLYLIRLAGTMDIDLIRAGEVSVDRAASTQPRLAPRERKPRT
jgi:hypothetical protein